MAPSDTSAGRVRSLRRLVPRRLAARKLSRRAWLRTVCYGFPAATAADASLVEPHWLRIERHRIGDGGRRVVHFSDTHYSGAGAYLDRVVDAINAESPDVVCFTGDIMEDARHLEGALARFKRIEAPIFGVPGNHDYSSFASFADIRTVFEKSGGGWLVQENGTLPDLDLSFVIPGGEPAPGTRILLDHYPMRAANADGGPFDLCLAGHSHGGQVRLPFYGALLLPDQVGPYELGMYDSPAGPLYVTAGIGTWYLPIRFGCRPDIAVFEL